MALNNLPSGLQKIIQEKYLERSFAEPLTAKLGFRAIADREVFEGRIGETKTLTRRGLRATPQQQLSNANSSDRMSGMTPSTNAVEQYTISLEQWGDLAESDLIGETVAIQSKWLMDAKAMGEQAFRKIDERARDALYTPYMGGNTAVAETLGSAGPAVKVDNAVGFAANDSVAVGASLYTVASVAFDGSNTSVFAQFGGRSGVITFTSNVTTQNGTIGKSVVNAKAAKVIRANDKANTSDLVAADVLNSKMLTRAVAEMEMNGVPKIDGAYNLYVTPLSAESLLDDPKVLNAFQGAHSSSEFRDGAISHVYGVRLCKSNMNPALGGVNRSLLVGAGALVESVFTEKAYANQSHLRDTGELSIVEDVAFIVSEPNDVLKKWALQAWQYIGGFCAPTDIGTNNSVLPTASGSSYKRAVVLESK